jgi:hypothetical protein
MTRIFCDACDQQIPKENPPLKPLAILVTDEKQHDLCRPCQDRIRQIVRNFGFVMPEDGTIYSATDGHSTS